jgi:hypothetical protein
LVRVGQKGSGAQSLSFYALIPSGPMAVHMGWATDDGVALVQCGYLMVWPSRTSEQFSLRCAMMIWRQGWLSRSVAYARQRDRGCRRPELWCNNSIYGLFLPLSCIRRCKISQCGNYGRYMALNIHTAAALRVKLLALCCALAHSFARVSNPGFPQSHRHHRGLEFELCSGNSN